MHMADNTPEIEPLDAKEARRQRWEARRAGRRARSGGWIGGAVLIALGLLFLLQNLGTFSMKNWWALFIMIPAVGAFASAWRQYQEAGNRLNAGVRGSLFGGLVLTIVAAAFLLQWSWGLVGPALLILVRLSVLAGGMFSGGKSGE
jgi:hypothetical protein